MRALEAKRDQASRDYDQASRDVGSKKEALLDEISRRLKLRTEMDVLFTIRRCLE